MFDNLLISWDLLGKRGNDYPASSGQWCAGRWVQRSEGSKVREGEHRKATGSQFCITASLSSQHLQPWSSSLASLSGTTCCLAKWPVSVSLTAACSILAWFFIQYFRDIWDSVPVFGCSSPLLESRICFVLKQFSPLQVWKSSSPAALLSPLADWLLGGRHQPMTAQSSGVLGVFRPLVT